MTTPVGRRAVLASACGIACAAALSGCAGYGPGRPRAVPPPPPGTPLAAVADVPVGGGVILADRDTVVTQPVEGEFRAFSATCTHEGCLVATVTDTINCTCHGSTYAVADGSVVAGPAPSPLAERAVMVTDGTVVSA
ncbi:Rieske (2Fe-2S) protein [Pseudonocardia hydrocarbonoxydans]|nr:Rieske (2Fe-2S) protein [Pseudonocardia hydrocarbonoxydans]